MLKARALPTHAATATLIIHPLLFFLLEPRRTFQNSEEKLSIFSAGKKKSVVDKMLLLSVLMSAVAVVIMGRR